MRKPNITALAALLLLSSCSGSDDESPSSGLSFSDAPVEFAASFVSPWRSATDSTATRAATDHIDGLDGLKTLDQGFGVFAYFTDATEWAVTDGLPSGGVPSAVGGSNELFFMFNQSVYWPKNISTGLPVPENETTGWQYAPPKYWPNSTHNETPRRISFFAYAPYVSDAEAAANDASATANGITSFSRGTAVGSRPFVTYRLGTTPGSQTDLMWANFANATRNGQGGIIQSTTNGSSYTFEKVPLNFQHALASVDIYVQRLYDGTASTPATTPSGVEPYSHPEADDTKIFVGVLSLATNLPNSGSGIEGLLYLEDGTWKAKDGTTALTGSGSSSQTFTFTNEQFLPWVAGSPNEAINVVRPYELDKWETRWTADATIDADRAATSSPSGVIEVPRRLNDAASTLFLLPATGVTITPTITYSFVTRDDALQHDYLQDTQGAGGNNTHRYSRLLHSNVTGNSIHLDIEPGKHYTLLLHIAVEHVSLEVTSVEDWDFPLRFIPSVLSDYEKESISHTVNEAH